MFVHFKLSNLRLHNEPFSNVDQVNILGTNNLDESRSVAARKFSASQIVFRQLDFLSFNGSV